MARTLDKKAFSLKDLNEMSGFTDEVLDNWIVYLIIVVKKNGKCEPYVGNSTNEGGSRERVIDYETTLRLAKDGFIGGPSLRFSKTLRHALVAPDFQKAYIRPLICVRIPKDRALRENKRKFVDDCEAVFSSLFRTLQPGCHKLVELGICGMVDHDHMVEFFRAIPIEKKYLLTTGLNLVAPSRQGYVTVGAISECGSDGKRRAAKDVQGIRCPLCPNGLREGEDHARINALKSANVAWCKADYICGTDHRFIKTGKTSLQ